MVLGTQEPGTSGARYSGTGGLGTQEPVVLGSLGTRNQWCPVP